MKISKKTKPAIWSTVFPEQAAKLRPESASKAGGVKARSGSEALRMSVYYGVAECYRETHPHCACRLPCCEEATSDVHHTDGRAGLLLFDVRHFLSVCRPCHDWIHAHPAEAAQRGWLSRNELRGG